MPLLHFRATSRKRARDFVTPSFGYLPPGRLWYIAAHDPEARARNASSLAHASGWYGAAFKRRRQGVERAWEWTWPETLAGDGQPSPCLSGLRWSWAWPALPIGILGRTP